MKTQEMKDSIDSLFAKWDRPDSPGAAVLVMKDGKIVHSKGYGYSNLEYDVPIAVSYTHLDVYKRQINDTLSSKSAILALNASARS